MSEEISEVDVPQNPSAPQQEPGAWSKFKKLLAKLPLDLIPLLVLFATVALVILYANDWKLWDGQRPLEVTNDAYVRADVTPLSTKVSGTVAKVFINDYESVKQGQLLVQLRDDDFIARADHAKYLYEQSLANEKALQHQIEVQTQRTENARLLVSVGREDLVRSGASVHAADASLTATKEELMQAVAQKQQNQERLMADQAVALRAAQERQRQEILFTELASTKQTVEQVVADDDRAKNVVAADRSEISRLQHSIDQRKADIEGKREDLKSAQAQSKQAELVISSRETELIGSQRQMDVLQAQLTEAKADTKARLAGWQEAKAELDYTRIVAPVDGVLSDRKVRAGQQVSAGTQVITLVSSVPWVIASFRETQMREVTVGDKAEVSVDALGGAVLTGTVQSLSPASEAQFALLPPDNPSGNFTKITQRLPVKIVFDKEQNKDQLSRIKPGMTVIAKIWTHD